MQRLIGALLVAGLIAPPAAFAADPSRAAENRSIVASAAREVARLAEGDANAARSSRQEEPGSRSWIARHPAIFGALVGAGAGVLAGATVENELICSGGDEDCLIYGGSRFLFSAAAGAGIGALVGWLVGSAGK